MLIWRNTQKFHWWMFTILPCSSRVDWIPNRSGILVRCQFHLTIWPSIINLEIEIFKNSSIRKWCNLVENSIRLTASACHFSPDASARTVASTRLGSAMDIRSPWRRKRHRWNISNWKSSPISSQNDLFSESTMLINLYLLISSHVEWCQAQKVRFTKTSFDGSQGQL